MNSFFSISLRGLCIACMFFFAATAVNAQSNNWTDDGSYAATWKGTGTQADPYKIGTAAELAKLSYETNNGTKPDYSGNYFRLTADIDMGAHYWTPVKTFSGTIDGNGHVIDNLHIGDNKGGAGFINDLTYYGVIQNLGIGSRSTITITSIGDPSIFLGIGGIVLSNQGIIKNCFNSGTILVNLNNFTYMTQIGGIAANNYRIIQDCYTNGTIQIGGNVSCYVGAIAGVSSKTVSNCFSTSTLNTSKITTGTDYYKGALVGYGSNGSITNSYYIQEGTTNAGLNGVGRVEKSLTNDTHPKTSAQLKDASFVNTLNTAQSTASWKADLSPNINNGFPILAWQNAIITALPQTTTNAIKFYPNPARNYIELQGTTTILPVKIFDMTGRMLMSTQVKPGEKVNIAPLAKGWYTINIDGQSLKMLKY